MPTQYPGKKALFGKRMNEALDNEEQPLRSTLSEDKARRLIDEREKEKNENLEIQEENKESESELKEKTDKRLDEKNINNMQNKIEYASHAFHFGKEKPPEIQEYSIKPLIDKKEKRKRSKPKHFRKEKSERGFTSLLKKVYNFFFSDLSFRRETCVLPKSSGGVDRLFLLFFIVLLSFGSIMVFSASYAYAEARYGDSTYFVRRQLIFMALGIGVLLFASIMTSKFYQMITPVAFGFTLLLLVAVLLFGVNLNGAQRWIGIGPITVQPTEIAKLTMVMLLAWYYARYTEKLRENRSLKSHIFYNTVCPGSIIAVVCGLVMLQKHLSGIIILGAVGIIVMFVAGSDGRQLAILMGAAAVGVTCLAIFTDYTKRRIDIWLAPEENLLDGGWQTIQGLYAIGSGGFLGRGFGDSLMKYSWVSEPANDFIFTITCEELGFVGAFFIILVFALLIWRGYVIAMHTHDLYARVLCLGIVTKIAVQILLNLAVITNSIPNTGIALPFFSYGGTSLIIQLLEVGIILSISRTSQLQKR